MPKSRLFVTDLDRTLIDPEQAVDLLDEVASQKGYATRHSWVSVAHSRKGLDFDFFDYLEQELHFSKAQIEDLTQTARKQRDPKHLFFDDTEDYLAAVTAHSDTKFLILTYGRERWQELKLQLSGLDRYPHIITEAANKGDTITHWQQAGHIVPPDYPELAADEVIAVDDKISGLQGLEKGYLIDRAGVLSTDKNTGIIVVKDLREVLTREGLAS